MNRLLSCSVATGTIFRLVWLVVVLNCSLASAQQVSIDYTDRGWYAEAGFHNPDNLTYVVGDLFSQGRRDLRNFFVFDLSSISAPIESASLQLSVPPLAPDNQSGYLSADPSETYELHDVFTPIASLLDGSGGIAAHADLGTGVVYGSRSMTYLDMGPHGGGGLVEITLNASAIAALNSAHGLFGIGGSLTSLDGIVNYESVFDTTGRTSMSTRLLITLVPEPSSGILCVTGVFSVLLRRSRRSCFRSRCQT